jgi:hypothetical protein
MRPREPNQLAKMIADVVAGEVADAISEEKKRPRPKRGQSGGSKGAKARAKRLSRKERARN